MDDDLTTFEGAACRNCGATLHGTFCHACGQSVRSVVKPVHGMFEDALDIVLSVDSRAIHTLPPLLLRPGFLTTEYFSGRRVRYITPFRLMVVLCLLAFFTLHMALNVDGIAGLKAQSTGVFATDATADEVHVHLARVQANLNAPVREQANRRLVELQAEPIAGGPSTDHADASATSPPGGIEIDKIHLTWLSDAMNTRLNDLVKRGTANATAMSNDSASPAEARGRFIGAMFSYLPQTMFVLIPVFALLLKVVYLFKRRLYMEHLVVALHSHAFLFLCLLLFALLSLAQGWLEPRTSIGTQVAHWLGIGLLVWLPIYLLIMQKRVYGQGWPMTVLKYLFVGWSYLWLLAIPLSISAALGLVN